MRTSWKLEPRHKLEPISWKLELEELESREKLEFLEGKFWRSWKFI